MQTTTQTQEPKPTNIYRASQRRLRNQRKNSQKFVPNPNSFNKSQENLRRLKQMEKSQ